MTLLIFSGCAPWLHNESSHDSPVPGLMETGRDRLQRRSSLFAF
ncbi:MAG: hypothetical protein OJF51_000560 [Nitrospira sp.]|nr:MAG: hypothetical protein OJF51_000560 [Nitrospira sp.]